MYLNKKGFTLVEIIVSIALASIILMLVGTLILTSTNLLNTSSERDLDKRTVESVIEFVREEIEYATDVRIVEPDSKYVPDYQNDANWHYFYIKDHKLYRDGIDVFTDGFYSNRKFNMTVKANYQNNTRVDIRYILNDGREETYTSRDTVMLLNLNVSDEMKNDGLYPSEYQPITEDGYRIYYNKKYTPPTNSQPENEKTGTVSDIINNISPLNFSGIYIQGYNYYPGEIVFFNNTFWECVTITKSYPGDSAIHWKCLDKRWTHTGASPELGGNNKFHSAYDAGDIVYYNGKYYRAKSKISGQTPNINETYIWEEISEIDAMKKTYGKNDIYRNDCLLNTYLKKEYLNGFELRNTRHEDVTYWNNVNVYDIGSLVKLEPTQDMLNNNPLYFDSQYSPIYIKIFNASSNVQPGTAESGWMLLDNRYHNKSSYDKNDVLSYRDRDNIEWYRAKIKIENNNTLNYIDFSGNLYWQKL